MTHPAAVRRRSAQVLAALDSALLLLKEPAAPRRGLREDQLAALLRYARDTAGEVACYLDEPPVHGTEPGS